MSADDKGLRTSNASPGAVMNEAQAHWHQKGREAVIDVVCETLGWSRVPLEDALTEIALMRDSHRRPGSAPNEPGPGGLSAIGEAARFFAWLKYDASDSERAVLASMVERIRTETADIVSEGKAEVMSELEALRIENEKLRSSAARPTIRHIGANVGLDADGAQYVRMKEGKALARILRDIWDSYEATDIVDDEELFEEEKQRVRQALTLWLGEDELPTSLRGGA